MKKIPLYIILLFILTGAQPQTTHYGSSTGIRSQFIITTETPYTWSSYWFSRASDPYYIYPNYEKFENPFDSEYIDSLMEASEKKVQEIMNELYPEEDF